jgi:hypothetical protein
MADAPSVPPARDAGIIALIGTGHFLSHFYMLCLPPLFIAWRAEFEVSFAELGLAIALMSAVTAALQTPVGFLVDRHGARPFLVGGTLLMALSISAMAFAPGYWAILLLAITSGIGNSVIHPADYAILGASIDKSRIGRAFALHTLASLGCSHRDAAKLRISSNVHLHEMAAAEDPCGSRAGAGSSSSGCPWGHCWSSAGRLWCFNREQTPLAHVLVQLFDFGTTTCKLPARQGEPW